MHGRLSRIEVKKKKKKFQSSKRKARDKNRK